VKVVIAGGHGQIALRLARQLADRGDQPVALIRNPDHADDVRAAGAEPVVLDLESAAAADATEALRGADAVVFAAGAGPGSGTASTRRPMGNASSRRWFHPQRKRTEPATTPITETRVRKSSAPKSPASRVSSRMPRRRPAVSLTPVIVVHPSGPGWPG